MSRGRPSSIAMVTPRYAPDIGGVETHVERLTSGLAARGVRVDVHTTDPTGRLPRVEVVDGVPVRRYPTVLRDGVYLVSPRLGRWLLRNATRYELVHVHGYHTLVALVAAAAARRRGVPYVLLPITTGRGHTPTAAAKPVRSAAPLPRPSCRLRGSPRALPAARSGAGSRGSRRACR